MNNKRSLKCELTNNRVFDGKVNLILSTLKGEKKVDLYMKLFDACPKHYAVLYKNEECTFRYGQFNYSRCLVEMTNESTRFHVHEKSKDSGLLFEASSRSEADYWIRAFQGRTKCPYSPLVRRKHSEEEYSATKKNFNLSLDVPCHGYHYQTITWEFFVFKTLLNILNSTTDLLSCQPRVTVM